MSKKEVRQALASGGLSLIVTPKRKAAASTAKYGKQRPARAPVKVKAPAQSGSKGR
jgi:hypothetical protein